LFAGTCTVLIGCGQRIRFIRRLRSIRWLRVGYRCSRSLSAEHVGRFLAALEPEQAPHAGDRGAALADELLQLEQRVDKSLDAGAILRREHRARTREHLGRTCMSMSVIKGVSVAREVIAQPPCTAARGNRAPTAARTAA
jgi:hypothetical protein